MQMIGHPTKGMNASSCTSQYVGNDVVELLPISRMIEQRFAMIAAQNDVIVRARNMNAEGEASMLLQQRICTRLAMLARCGSMRFDVYVQ